MQPCYNCRDVPLNAPWASEWIGKHYVRMPASSLSLLIHVIPAVPRAPVRLIGSTVSGAYAGMHATGCGFGGPAQLQLCVRFHVSKETRKARRPGQHLNQDLVLHYLRLTYAYAY